MMKYLRLTFLWSAVLVAHLFWASPNLTEADPTDDFSFSLGNSAGTGVYGLIPEHRVAEILSTRLDLFPRSKVPHLARHIITLCKKYRFNPSFILSLIEVESAFKVKAVSSVGALGLMQVMPPTAQFVIKNVGFQFSGHENFSEESLRQKALTPDMLMEPFVNTAIGIAYLAWLRDYYVGHSPYHILAAYNVGPGRLDQLLARKSFCPTETKKYFLNIRRGVSQIRYYNPPVRKRLKRKRTAPSRPCTQLSPMV
jgi:hypothetical protein